MHVILHDLHGDHHDAPAKAYLDRDVHDHQHPIVSSLAPLLPSLTRTMLPVISLSMTSPFAWKSGSAGERNLIAFGSLRLDDDVGLQPLLSTFLI